jgi:hypothetical protein
MRTLGLALAVTLLWAGGAQARREQTYSYPFSRVWTAAVRMLRVDFESAITEKDKDSGYFLFNFADAGKIHPGSIEVVRIQNGNLESVRVVVQVPALPTYFEQMMLDRLARKLGQDYGQPPTPKTPPPTTGVSPEQSTTPGENDSSVREQTADGSTPQQAPKAEAKTERAKPAEGANAK